MKDDKNKNKKDNTLLYLILGIVALVVWVEFDKQLEQAKKVHDMNMSLYYYDSFMQ